MPLLLFSSIPSFPPPDNCLQVASATHVFIFDLVALNPEPALDTLLSCLLQSTQVIAPCGNSWLV